VLVLDRLVVTLVHLLIGKENAACETTWQVRIDCPIHFYNDESVRNVSYPSIHIDPVDTQVVCILARKTNTFMIVTDSDGYTHQAAIIQIEFVRRTSTVLIITMFHC
jgi:hypothetical protein